MTECEHGTIRVEDRFGISTNIYCQECPMMWTSVLDYADSVVRVKLGFLKRELEKIKDLHSELQEAVNAMQVEIEQKDVEIRRLKDKDAEILGKFYTDYADSIRKDEREKILKAVNDVLGESYNIVDAQRRFYELRSKHGVSL